MLSWSQQEGETGMRMHYRIPACLLVTTLTLIVSACGSREAQGPGTGAATDAGANAPPAGSVLGLVRDAGSGPSIEQVRTRLLDNVNVVCRTMQENPNATGAMGKVTAIHESSRKSDKAGEVESVILNYTADIEFSAPCEYQDGQRKPGDHLAVHGEAEFMHDAEGWKQLPLTVWAH
jgi:hypothetical protein